MNRFSVFATALAACLLLVVPVAAEKKVDLDALRVERDERLERYSVRELTKKRLDTAVEYLEAGEYARAREKLARLKFSRLNPYEKALAFRYLAYASMAMDDLAAGARYFEQAVEEEILPIAEEADVRFNIAQIYASMGEWEKVEATLEEWFHYVEKPNPVAYYLLAISHYRRDQYDQSLVPAVKALELSNDPKESWFQLVAALYLEKEDFESATPIFEELVTRFRKKQYWVQLSLIYSARGNYEHALQVQQLAYAQGLLSKDDELRRLARSYLFHSLPYPAANVLERSLEEGRIEPDGEVLELLGNSWIAAREYDRSIGPLQRAANLAEDGRLYLRLGQVRVQREDWKEATALIQKAIEKGGLEDVGKAQLLLGISYYSDDRRESARSAFRRAREHESTRTDAKAWLEHIARQGQEADEPSDSREEATPGDIAGQQLTHRGKLTTE